MTLAACRSTPAPPPPAPPSGQARQRPSSPPARRAVASDEELVERLRDHAAGRAPQIAACYEAALAKTPALSGRLLVQLELSTDGAVAALTLLEDTFEGRGEIGACVSREVSSWDLGVKLPEEVTVEWPFHFEPRLPLSDP